MNSMIGKSTGIALLMAAALLAALFAMGVFSATGVGADSHQTTASDDTDQLGATGLVVVADDDEAIEANDIMGVFAPADGDAATHIITVPPDASTIKLVATGGGTETDWEATASITAEVDGKSVATNYTTSPVVDTFAVGEITVDLTNGLAKVITITVDDGNANNGTDDDEHIPGTYTLTLSYTSATGNEQTANAPVIVTLSGDNLAGKVVGTADPQEINVVQGGDLTVTLSGFGVPSNIDPDTVRVSFEAESGTPATDSRKPSSIDVSDTTVTLTMGTVEDQGEIGDADGNDVVDGITFQRKAGITNPSIANASADEYTITVKDSNNDEAYGYGLVFREVSTKPATAVRGTEFTITGKGFVDGPVDVATVGGVALGTANSSDGVFEHSITNDRTTGADDADVFTTEGTSINATDNAGASAPVAGKHTIKAGFTIDPESTAPGKTVEVKVTDQDGMLESVTIRGASIDLTELVSGHEDTDPLTFDLTIPSDTKVADKQQVRLVVQPPTPEGETTAPAKVTLTGTINIISNPLTITPSTVVPRQEVSIDGGGFSTASNSNFIPASDQDEDGEVTTSNVMFGSHEAQNARQLVNNSGNVSFNVRVPDGVAPGSVKVTVKDAGGRVGQATITVAEPEVTLNPAESLIGSEITVSGTGFPANDLVLIKYNNAIVDTSPTDSTGVFSQVITVPSGAGINPGNDYTVEASAQVQAVDAADKTTAEADHTLPDPSITLSPDEVSAGSSLTVSGSNYKGFLQIYRIEVGGQNVTPVPAPTTDQWGAFTATVQVPQLTPGRYAVSARLEDADGDAATEFIQVVTEVAVPVTDPADVFADLVTADRLSRVWFLDAENQEWMFYDPDPEVADFNDLTEVKAGSAYIIIVTEGDPVEFQGRSLYQGTNNIPLR